MKELEGHTIGPNLSLRITCLRHFLLRFEVSHIPITAVLILTPTFVQSTQKLQLLPHRKHGPFFRKTNRLIAQLINDVYWEMALNVQMQCLTKFKALNT